MPPSIPDSGATAPQETEKNARRPDLEKMLCGYYHSGSVEQCVRYALRLERLLAEHEWPVQPSAREQRLEARIAELKAALREIQENVALNCVMAIAERALAGGGK